MNCLCLSPLTLSLSNYKYHSPQLLFSGGRPFGGKEKRAKFHICKISNLSLCRGGRQFGAQEKRANFHIRKVINCHAANIYNVEALEVCVLNEIKKLINIIKSMLGSIGDGELSISAYDTAWVALIKDVNGNDSPQFPSCLHWIVDHQLPDGSWGDDKIFLAHDRLINTLACVVALKSWNVHLDKCEKGISFMKENIPKLEKENDEHTTSGFEVAFPSLLEKARSLEIEVPDDFHVLQKIYAMRNFKLKRIPIEKMHSVPTTLLFSLEGMRNLDWERLLKLQFQDGSFLCSLSSTAYAFMQTEEENCLKYITKVVQRFNGVPFSYPMDLFEQLWVVDRLQRLGISRYFKSELKKCMDHVYRNWSEDGIFSARNSQVPDIDDTCMGFRLLRLHGYEVSPDVLQHFEENGEFFCFVGECSQSITPIFNLYRASQVQFPGEKILEKAKQFSARFLREKKAANKLLDKWVIAKDLPGEVSYALDIPWYASLPRVEARFYIDQYGGEDDVWIAKVLYRMPFISNNFYLELAKLDYNNCQAIHQTEWISMQKWYTECKLKNFGTSGGDLLLSYFLASASIYESERWPERIAWAKTAVLVQTITSYFNNQQDNSSHQRKAFVDEFRKCINTQEGLASNKTGHGFTGTLLGKLIYLSLFDTMLTQDRDHSRQLLRAWEKWLLKWQVEGDRHQGEAELILQTINLSAGNWLSEEQYGRLLELSNTICYKLGQYQKQKVHDTNGGNGDFDSTTALQIDTNMQELVQLVHQNSSNGIDSNAKQTFLTVTKSFYYSAYCDPKAINFHIDKVLFGRVQ